jgi:hypothetical protein
MSDLDSLLNVIPIDQVASALGVDTATAKVAVETALPAILAGLHHEASTEAGAGNLAEAVGGKDPSILDGLSLDQIDPNDGEKILGHIFGTNTSDVTSAVGATNANVGSDLVKKLMPLLAPIVLAWLAQQATKTGGQVNRSNGGLLQEILGGLLTGAGQAADNKSTGSVVTDILGQILRSR